MKKETKTNEGETQKIYLTLEPKKNDVCFKRYMEIFMVYGLFNEGAKQIKSSVF